MTDKEKFIPGLYFNTPRAGAPDYVKGGLVIDFEQFLPWANERAKAEPKLRADLKESREGKGYAQIDDWKPNQGTKPGGGPKYVEKAAPQRATTAEPEDDIPF